MDRDTFLHDTFPKGFAWSSATASTQIEGAWNTDGKGVSIWDTFAHDKNTGNIANGDTPDVACDSYHKHKEDIKMMKQLKLTHYRFSISWPRLMPDGTKSSINEAGIAYYNTLINDLREAGIEPMVTLYHWDLPQTLQDQGGWPNEELIKHFCDYARLCFQRFGDRVRYWVTFNEPMVFVYLGYGIGYHAPGIQDPLGKCIHAAHTVIKAHAQVYHLYKNEFYDTQKGEIGLVNNSDWCEPKDSSEPSHVEAAERAMLCKLGWFSEPVYGTGDYPEVFKQQIQEATEKAGLPPLPKFTEEEIKLNKGSADFYGLNHYTTRLLTPRDENSPKLPGLSFGQEIFGVVEEIDKKWMRGASSWLYIVPWGIRRNIRWVCERYGNMPLYITENGVSDHGEKDDQLRQDYFNSYVNEVLKACKLDGCDVRGYTAWSLMDNFEWSEGYAEHFGFFSVDFNDPERTRTPKGSVRTFAEIVKNNGFPEEPQTPDAVPCNECS